MYGRLPKFFKYKTAKDLVRIGRDYDGGYLVSSKDIDKSDFLIGLGICDDWSFESDFTSRNPVPVNAYDASVNFRFLIMKAVLELLKHPFNFYNIKKFIFQGIGKFVSYKIFFRGKRKHIRKFVGLNSTSGIHCTLASVLNEVDAKNIFLKIDVEGSEYRFLDTLIEHQNRITGLVVELHDCDLHLAEIKKFIDDIGLSLVHIHANNYAPVRLEDELPLVLELTFSSNAKLGEREELPHLFDMPNNMFKDEIRLVVEK